MDPFKTIANFRSFKLSKRFPFLNKIFNLWGGTYQPTNHIKLIFGSTPPRVVWGYPLTFFPSHFKMNPTGVRLDSQLQECQDAHWKQSFPDLDYAFFGYDILNGYPLSIGHDPGFTHPIFLSDYTSGKQTSDCRYSVPKGLVVVPDVSCETSFSSKVIRNRLEMSKSLETAANIEGVSPTVSKTFLTQIISRIKFTMQRSYHFQLLKWSDTMFM